jgi:serine/threonine protein kinase
MRWYRAPEILLDAPFYDTPIDIFALACVAAEMLDDKGNVLFPGTTHVDQLCKVLNAVGTPTVSTWPEGVELMNRCQVQFHETKPESFHKILPFGIEVVAFDWLRKCLSLNPVHRLTADAALQHDFLVENHPPNDEYNEYDNKDDDYEKVYHVTPELIPESIFTYDYQQQDPRKVTPDLERSLG